MGGVISRDNGEAELEKAVANLFGPIEGRKDIRRPVTRSIREITR